MKIVMALAALALVAAPVVADALLTIDGSAADLGVYYVSENGALFEESNGAPGLQEVDEFDLDGNLVLPADNQLA